MASDRFHGLLIVDKPAGWTSHDVVGKVRRLLGQRSVGHAGTLDPAATGVLPIAVGSALRALEFLAGASKTYRAEVTLGISTDALDVDGRLTAMCHVPQVDILDVQDMLATFLGPREQTPPAYSAIKVDGTPLYDRARRGELMELPKRAVEIYRLELMDWETPVLKVEIDCSKGFYVRSFAQDFGSLAGSCAHLSNLVRTRVGPFSLCESWSLTELDAAPLAEEWERIALSPDAPALGLPTVIIDSGSVPAWEQGKRWTIESSARAEAVRVYDSVGNWLGIGEIADLDGCAHLCPRKVVPRRDSVMKDHRR